MPVWFQNQLMRAFFQKDTNQIKLLNQFWYYYIRYLRKRSHITQETNQRSSTTTI